MLSAYRVLLQPPGARRLIVSVLVGRLPIGIFSLAIVLLVRAETDSFAQAGAASAAWAVGAGALAPIQGRMVDRFGQPAVLLPSTATNALAVTGVLICAHSHGSTFLLAVFSFLGGAGLPPLGACMRSVWATVFAGDSDARSTAYTFEGTIAELFFILGPVVTTVVVAIGSTTTALIVAIALSVVGTISFATAPLSREWRAVTTTARTAAGALGSPGIRTLILAILPTGVSFGALEVAMPAFAVAHGHEASIAGILLSVMAAGSVLGGVWYGARTWKSPLVKRFVSMHVVLALGTLPLLLADSVWVMGGLALIAGLALAPSAAAGYLLIDHVAPPGTSTEATTWMMTANVAGAAVGSALAGVIVDSADVRWALALACAGPVLGAVISVSMRGKLRPAARPEVAAPISRDR